MLSGTIFRQRLTLIKEHVVADSLNYMEAAFDFCTGDWDGLTKWAHFANGETVYDIRLTGDRIRKEDRLNLTAGEWKVYLHGNEFADGEVVERITTNVEILHVLPTGTLDGEPFPEIPASVTEQILARLAQIEQNGNGTVTAVAGVEPDETGNVPLKAADIGAADEKRLAAAIADAERIFIAEYEKTTLEEIDAAFNAGKVCYCRFKNLLYPHIYRTAASHMFAAMDMGTKFRVITLMSDMGWFYADQEILSALDVVNSVSPDSTKDKIPSAKATYDAIIAYGGAASSASAESVVNRTRTVSPLVTFVDDDGRADVWTKLYPVSAKYGIPFVAAMVTDRIDGDNSLTAAQLRHLQDSMGWEIASHTMGHVSLGELTDAEQEEQLKGSKEALEAIGIKCDTICYPYSSVSENTWKIARKYYRCGRQTNWHERLNESPLETWDLRVTPLGAYFETQTESGLDTGTLEYYKYQVDRAAAGNAWLIFLTHCAETDDVQMGYLAQVIEYVQSLGIPIVTMREALDMRGNIVDVGRWNRRNPDEEHFVVGCDGKVEKSDDDTYTFKLPNNFAANDTAPSAFPVPAISTCRVTGDTGGFPFQVTYYGGTLVTNSMGLKGTVYSYDTDYDSGRMWQEFYLPNSTAVYRRYAVDADTWSDWSYGSDVVLAADSRAIDDVVGKFPKGVKSKVWITQDGASVKRPDGSNGWLMTDRTDVNEKLFWQTFIPQTSNNPKGNIYFRRWTGSVWDDWTCLGERVGSTNMLGWSTTPKYVGASVFDTTRGKPVWWNGTEWVDAAGAVV